MSEHIVFVTLLLGLLSGPHAVEVKVGPAVKSVRLLLNDDEVAHLTEPPWRARIDLGARLQPHRITAVALNENGVEIARVQQIVNLARRAAEVDIALQGNSAELAYKHIGHAKPISKIVRLDDVPLALDHDRVTLPSTLDRSRPHMLSADIHFEDGVTAKGEVVFGGTLPDMTEAELTPVALTQTSAKARERGDGCFTSRGQAVRASAIEKAGALVFIVRDPSANDAMITIDPMHKAKRDIGQLDADTTLQMVWAVADRLGAPTDTTVLFPMTKPTREYGLLTIITRASAEHQTTAQRQYADAVAVAAERAAAEGKRRAVVLVLGHADRDGSDYDPKTVQHYLESVGVPLFVWSFAPTEGLAAQWKNVVDISTPEKLRTAADKLQRVLDAQRIAWLDADPVTALHATLDPSCGYTPVAKTR